NFNGATGTFADTTVTTAFTQPAAGATVTVTVGSTAKMAANQALFIASGGRYTVQSVSNGTQVVLTNPGDLRNTTASATIEAGARVSARPMNLVLLIRGELLRRFPNTTIYARQAAWNGTQRTMTTVELYPVFSAMMDPDITLLGFGLDEASAVGM